MAIVRFQVHVLSEHFLQQRGRKLEILLEKAKLHLTVFYYKNKTMTVGQQSYKLREMLSMYIKDIGNIGTRTKMIRENKKDAIIHYFNNNYEYFFKRHIFSDI